MYNAGTESGLLNIAPRTFHIAASDGSVDANGAMWAGVFVEKEEEEEEEEEEGLFKVDAVN